MLYQKISSENYNPWSGLKMASNWDKYWEQESNLGYWLQPDKAVETRINTLDKLKIKTFPLNKPLTNCIRILYIIMHDIYGVIICQE
jgi:hypothetical protein